jgi:hypothetical protein
MKQFAIAAFLGFMLCGAAAAQTVMVPDPQGGPTVRTLPPPPPATPQPPNAPPRLDTFGDKASRCVHYGTSIGVKPGQIGQYTRDCVNR